MNYELTNKHRNRLMKLATYLDTLPKDYKEFDMDSYFANKDDDEKSALEREYALHNGGVSKCGTSACAVGHGPSAGILVPDHLIEKGWAGHWLIDWEAYSQKFCGRDMLLFNWMFGSYWSEVDNHHYGAAARIKYVLMDHDIPEYFRSSSAATSADVKLYNQYRKRKHKEQ